jgi:hypothetical protein
MRMVTIECKTPPASPSAQHFTLVEQLDQVAQAQTRAHAAWTALRAAQAEWERLQVAADLRLGSLLLGLDVAIGTDGGPDAA